MSNGTQTVGKESDSISLVGGHIGGGEEDVGQYEEVEERDTCDDVFVLIKEAIEEIFNDLYKLTNIKKIAINLLKLMSI